MKVLARIRQRNYHSALLDLIARHPDLGSRKVAALAAADHGIDVSHATIGKLRRAHGLARGRGDHRAKLDPPQHEYRDEAPLDADQRRLLDDPALLAAIRRAAAGAAGRAKIDPDEAESAATYSLTASAREYVAAGRPGPYIAFAVRAATFAVRHLAAARSRRPRRERPDLDTLPDRPGGSS